MSEEEKAIKVLQEFKKTGFHTLSLKYDTDRIHTNKLIENSIDTVLNLIDKQNKVIDEMAKYMEDRRECGQAEEFCDKENCYADEYINGYCQKCLNCIKQYFIRKVEENDNSTSK